MKSIEQFSSGVVTKWFSSSMHRKRMCDGLSGGWLLVGLLACGWQTPAAAQSFNIYTNNPFLSNGAVQINFPTRTDSYYLLQATPSLSIPFGVDAPFAKLGNGGGIGFAPSLSPTGSMFYRVEQLSLTSTNSFLNDGIADGFKLLHSLPIFGPSQTTNIPLGYNTNWLAIYRRQTNLAALPLAYFPSPTTTVVVGASNVTVPVALTLPYTGYLTYQLSGTAVPSSPGVTGDYVPPTGSVFVNNGTTANIKITLVPEPDIEINRSIVIALSAPPLTSQTYTITTNSCVATVQVLQSSLSSNGVFVGSLAFTNGLFAGGQSVKMAMRPGSGNSTVALFDVTGNSLLGNTFSVSVNASTNGFQLNGGQFSNVVTNTPWGRNLNVALSFGSTQTNSNGMTFTTPVTMNLGGLTASGVTYSGSGTLTVARSQ
jgi:hypothetical protein